MNLPGVGKNLQDHIDYVQTWRTLSDSDTFGVSLRGTARLTSAIFEWRNKRSGMITSNFAEAGAFLCSSPEVTVPDLQLHFVIGIVDDHARKLHLGHGMSCHVSVMRPFSRGTVSLRSTDPRAAPLIDPRLFDDERDFQLLLSRRCSPARARRGRLACSRCIDLPDPDRRQHQCADHHGRRKAVADAARGSSRQVIA